MSSLPLFPIESPAGASITGQYFTRISQAQSGLTNSRSFGGGLWNISIDLALKTRDEHDVIFAFLNARLGRHERFRVKLPIYCNSKSGYAGDIFVKTSEQTGSSVSAYNMPANTLILKAGDFIKFENYDKVYQVSADITTDGAGEASIPIVPNLVSSPPTDEKIISNDVEFVMRNTTDEITLGLDQCVMASWNITLQEAWQS